MQELNESILGLTRGYLAHQVNCLGIMGGGIAKNIRELFPKVYDEYRVLCKAHLSNREKLLGHCQIVNVSKDLYVVNLFGQFNINDANCDTDYVAVQQALESFKQKRKRMDISVYFPYKIGCGLAGGDWKIYSELLERYFPDENICRYRKLEGGL